MTKNEIIEEVKKYAGKYEDSYNEDCIAILTEQLNNYRKDRTDEHFAKVCNALELCLTFDAAVYAGAVYSRAKNCGEYGFEGIPFCEKYFAVNSEGELAGTFYLTEEDAEKPLLNEELFLCYPLKKLLTEFAGHEKGDYIFIAPYGFSISKTLAAKLVNHYKETFSFMDPARTLCPRCVIVPGEHKTDGFRLHSYPVMPDGSVLVTESRNSGADREYRVSRYELGTAEPTDFYEFSIKGKNVDYVFADGGKLYALACNSAKKYSLYRINGGNAEKIAYVGDNVCAAACDGMGHFMVGFSNCINAPVSSPVELYCVDGEAVANLGFEPSAGCRAITTDGNGNFAWTTRPGNGFEWVVIDEQDVDNALAEYGDFDAFGFSDDNKLLLAVYNDTAGHSLLFRMTLSENGCYLDAKSVNIMIKTDDGDDNGEYAVDGKVSVLGSTLVWNRDGRLYIFDINDLLGDEKNDEENEDEQQVDDDDDIDWLTVR